MKSIPTSVLWLLSASNSRGINDTYNYHQHNSYVEKNIYAFAAMFGIDRRRIVFKSRVSKSHHIKRYVSFCRYMTRQRNNDSNAGILKLIYSLTRLSMALTALQRIPCEE